MSAVYKKYIETNYAQKPTTSAISEDWDHMLPTWKANSYRWRIVDFWIWPRNKASQLSVEVARLTKTKEGPDAEVPSEGNVDHLLWPPRHGPSWICTTRSDSKPAFLQRGTDPVDGKNSAQEKELWASNTWILHHDNAPAHAALSVRQSLATKQVTILYHPPYLPDLAPCDYFLFPKLKGTIKGTRFEGVEDIKSNVTSFLKRITKEDFAECFQAWRRRMEKCTEVQGITLKEIISVVCLNF